MQVIHDSTHRFCGLYGAATTHLTPQPTMTPELVGEIELWLDTKLEPSADAPIRWKGRAVRNLEHLAVGVSMLQLQDFGLADRATVTEGRWGQTMRTEAGWIVEVHDGTEADFAQRVYRAGSEEYPQRSGNQDELGAFEVFSSFLAAELLWSWLHGGLPHGFARTLRHYSRDQQRRYGLQA